MLDLFDLRTDALNRHCPKSSAPLTPTQQQRPTSRWFTGIPLGAWHYRDDHAQLDAMIHAAL
jgi:hypothetical protein